MSEWGIAILAAASAIAGSLVGGYFARGAGKRQASAAIAAAEHQVDALFSTVRDTLDEQSRARVVDARRQAYVQLLSAVDGYAMLLGARFVSRAPGAEDEARIALRTALSLVDLEGPVEVSAAAKELADDLFDAPQDREGVPMSVPEKRAVFMDAARQALAP
ncbi:hypothetical protein [Streptomyces sp. NPDC058583]|uniref:hypothetical protein n=1 Tax=unclassified Streptomyces TaxID=2593676 RepID=UPI003666DC36